MPASGYYAWQQAQQQKLAQREPAWETALVKAFGVPKRCYGTRRRRVELRRKGYRVGRQRLRTARRRRGLHALPPKALIAERLNASRFLTRTGKAFRAEQVKRLYVRVLSPGATLA